MTTLVLEFTQPIRLWALTLIPIITRVCWYLTNRISRSQSPSPRLRFVTPKDVVWKRHGVVLLTLLSLTSLVIAWAMPKDYGKQTRDQTTIVIAIDISWSMEAGDMSPNQPEAAKESAEKFIANLPRRFNIALVTFTGTASTSVPPTVDRGVLNRVIDNIQVTSSTAIEGAAYTNLDMLKLVPPDPDHPDTAAPATIVLLSDGASNLGWDSIATAQQSKQLGAPIYTIAYSTQNGCIESSGRRERVAVDHRELYVVAENSGGRESSVESAGELSEIYQAISSDLGYELAPIEITGQYAGLVVIFAVLAAMGVISLEARWP